jgi:enoyl-CoA hydratase/carnithine racemase
MTWEKPANDNRTAILYIDHVHNPSSVKEFSSAIDEILADGHVRSVVLASRHEKNWCIGMDIPWIMEQYRSGSRAAMKELFISGTRSMFLGLLTIPLVSMAAITGHTYGNGVMLALHCDIRFMRSDRGYFCLPEAGMDLADAFTPSGLKLMEARYDPFIKDVMIPTAKKVTAAELAEKHIIDRACATREAVMESALARAREISADDGLYRNILEDRKRWSLPVIEVMQRDDEAAFDYIIDKFWKLMGRMG